MRRSSHAALLLVAGAACFTHRSQRGFPSIADISSCTVEQVTDAGPDDGHFQFHGPSTRGVLAVGTFRGDSTGAYLLDLRSGSRTPLDGINNGGAFAPDGRRLLVANRSPQRRRELVELDVITGTRRVIASDSAALFLGTYRRDGGEILFNWYRTGRSDIYTLGADRRTFTRITEFDGYDAHADYSPDGRTAVFHREVTSGDYDIFVVDLATHQERRLVGGSGEQAYPAWSPDGRWIAHIAPAQGAPGSAIGITDTSGRATHLVTRGFEYLGYPAWSPDGRSLYFNARIGEKRNVFRVRLNGAGGSGCHPPGS